MSLPSFGLSLGQYFKHAVVGLVFGAVFLPIALPVLPCALASLRARHA